MLVDELVKLEGYVDHYHLSDASGTEGEGLQFGEGDLPFGKIIPILNKYDNKSFSLEIWRGHELGGKGFREFLDRIIENGLIIN
jgi:sugar phosphate isomerase/epimerase